MKPIIVTGIPKSYTHLTTHLFERLGMKTTPDIQEVNEDMMFTVDTNYKPFVSEDTVSRIPLNRLYPNAANLDQGMSKEDLEKSSILLCLRDPKESIAAIDNMFMRVNRNPDFDKYPFNYVFAEYRFFLNWLKDNQWFLEHLMVFNTSDFFDYPIDAVMTLASVASLQPSYTQVMRIASDIWPKKELSLNTPSNCVKMVKYCETVFDYMIVGEFNHAIDYNWSFKL
jgi:hypothetical protein